MRSVRVKYSATNNRYAVGFYRKGEFIAIKQYDSTFEMVEAIEAWCQEGTEP